MFRGVKEAGTKIQARRRATVETDSGRVSAREKYAVRRETEQGERVKWKVEWSEVE